MAGAISDQTTNYSNVSLTGSLAVRDLSTLTALSNVSSSRITGANAWITSQVSTPDLRVQGGALLSGVTADFRTNSVKQSWETLADVSALTIGLLGIVFQASGISLIYSSGKSVYVLGQSSQSAAGA